MSNALAVAAVTATLRRLIERAVQVEGAGIVVTARPPDRATQGNGGNNRVNLFLYHTATNAAWRNQDLPATVRAGEVAAPLLPLDLFYLVTAYSEGDDEIRSHRLLGRAMSVLHDHPLLGAAEIKSALDGSELDQQVERVRITPQPLSVDEISKLWSGFQTQYRLSVAYQVSVVLIESTRAGRAALPVLKRGRDDRGVISAAVPLASLAEARSPRPLPAAQLGDPIVLVGQNLSADDVSGRVRNARLAKPISIDVARGPQPDELEVRLPDPAATGVIAAWVAGFNTIALVYSRPSGPEWTSNEIAFALAPTITVTSTQPSAGRLLITVKCVPRLRDGQRVTLIVGEQQVEPTNISTPASPAAPSTVKFDVSGLAVGRYPVRLRVDGVDSIPLARPGLGTAIAMEFDPAQTVVVA
jgi:hypothetical protein